MKYLLTITTAALFSAGIAHAEDHRNGHPMKHEKHAERSAERNAHYFAMMDANGDKELTQIEVVDHARTQFNKMDANADGIVTPQELQKHRKAKLVKHGRDITHTPHEAHDALDALEQSPIPHAH